MLKEKITVGQAVALINNSIIDFQDGLSPDILSKITYAVNNELQVRDYLIGLPATFPMDTCKSFLTYLSDSVDESERYAYLTVNSMYYYETENNDIAILLLATAQNINSEYPLAGLISRVMQAGWPSETLSKMRNELHEQVLDKISEMQDNLI